MAGFALMQPQTTGTAVMPEKGRASLVSARPRKGNAQVGVLLYATSPHAPTLAAAIAALLFPTVSDSPAIAFSTLRSISGSQVENKVAATNK